MTTVERFRNRAAELREQGRMHTAAWFEKQAAAIEHDPEQEKIALAVLGIAKQAAALMKAGKI